MEAHFQRAIWPITATAAFFGLALIEYPLGKPRRFLTLIYATLVVSVQVGVFMIYSMFHERKGPNFIKSITDVMIVSCNFIILASICLTHWHGKRYYKCMERFNEVDETLRALGIEIDYSKLRRIGILALITWAIMYIVVNGYNCVQYARLFFDNRTGLYLFFLAMPLYIRMLTDMQFWSVLGYSGTRFDYFSSALRKLTIDDNNRASFRNSKLILVRGIFVPDERTRRIIWTVMHLHFELCEILHDINTVFEVQMSFQMGCNYVLLLSSVMLAFRLILLPFEVEIFRTAVAILLSALLPLVDIIFTNHLCETVGAKARTVCDVAVQLLCFIDEEGTREDVSFMVLQTKLRPLKFSCLGLYYFGYDFIYKIFCTVVTTAVIVLQLKAGLQL